MALTFGTLLSSQRADAQQVNPLGRPRRLDVQHYAVSSGPASGGLDRRTSRSARRMENHTRPREGVHGGSRTARSPFTNRRGRRDAGPSSEAEEALDPDRQTGPQADLADLPVRAAHKERYTTLRTPCRGSRGVREMGSSFRRPRSAGTARSPAGRRASSSSGCSAPRCAGTSRP
jgi:hypothetical protein